MIQYVKFATLDPVGFALVRVDDIRAIQTVDAGSCKLTTPHDQIIVEGSYEYFSSVMSSLVGGEWSAAPEGASSE